MSWGGRDAPTGSDEAGRDGRAARCGAAVGIARLDPADGRAEPEGRGRGMEAIVAVGRTTALAQRGARSAPRSAQAPAQGSGPEHLHLRAGLGRAAA